MQLSQHKFASNVIEKCLEYTDSPSRGILIKEIVGDGNTNDNLLVCKSEAQNSSFVAYVCVYLLIINSKRTEIHGS